MLSQIYPTELQLHKANTSDTEALFGLRPANYNGIVSAKLYDTRVNIEFEIFKFLLLDGDVPCYPSYGVYILQLTHFARLIFHVDDFNNRNKFVTSMMVLT